MGISNTANTPVVNQGASLVAAHRLMRADDYVLPQVLPVVPVSDRTGTYLIIQRGSMTEATDTARAPGAQFAEEAMFTDGGTWSCKGRGLRSALPEEHRAELDPQMGQPVVQFIGSELTHRILATEDRVLSSTIFNASTYNAGNGNGIAVSNAWTGSAGTPKNDIDTGFENLATKWPGLRPEKVVLLISEGLRRKLRTCNQVLSAGYNSQNSAGLLTPEQLAETLGVGKVVIGRGAYKTSGTTSSPTNTKFWRDDYAFLFIMTEFENLGKPVIRGGLGCTFAWTSIVPATLGAMPAPIAVVQYTDNETMSEKVRVATSLDQKIINADAGYLMTGT